MRKIRLSRGLDALIDDCDYELVSKYKWYAMPRDKAGKYHAATAICGDTYFMHRLILGVNNPNQIVDHVDNDGLNNQRHNLRVGTQLTNAYHRPKRGDSRLRYKGISRNGNKWGAQIKVNRKRIWLGVFDTDVEAAIAYNEAAVKYHGEYAFLNVIQSEEEYSGA